MAHPEWTDERRQAARERLLKRMTPEWRAKQSERGRLRRHSEETKRKISESNRGKKMSPEARAKMSAAKKGKSIPEAERQRLREIAKKPKSPEARKRMSAAVKLRFQDPARQAAHSLGRRKFWASLTPEEKSKIARPGRLACLEATRLREPTSIEAAVACALRARGVRIEQQVLFTYYIADIYLPDYTTVIECDGDYWHSTPKMKAHDIKRDKWFAKHGIVVVRIWERDIRADVQGCVERALKDIM